jgi:hypothetical protein
MRLRKASIYVFTYFTLAFGDVSFQVPGAGLQYSAGAAITVTWIDSGIAPSISDLTAYQLALYTGSNASPVRITFTASPARNNRAITDTDALGTIIYA